MYQLLSPPLHSPAAPSKCIPSLFTYSNVLTGVDREVVAFAFSPNCYTHTSTGGSHSSSVQTCGYSTTSSALLSAAKPNAIVYVNDLPSPVYGSTDHGLGLCHYIAPGTLSYTKQLQSPYKITNYDDNLHSTPKNEVNFIQVDITTVTNLFFLN